MVQKKFVKLVQVVVSEKVQGPTNFYAVVYVGITTVLSFGTFGK